MLSKSTVLTAHTMDLVKRRLATANRSRNGKTMARSACYAGWRAIIIALRRINVSNIRWRPVNTRAFVPIPKTSNFTTRISRRRSSIHLTQCCTLQNAPFILQTRAEQRRNRTGSIISVEFNQNVESKTKNVESKTDKRGVQNSILSVDSQENH